MPTDNSLPLSAEQMGFFHDQGYLIIEDLTPVDELQPVIDEITSEINTRAKQLVDSNEENGCMWVIPGTHRLPIVPHKLACGGKYLGIDDNDLPVGEWVCCPVRKGGALLMTNRTVHGSFLNKTEGVRWSVDLRYQSASLPTNAPITRLPGEAEPSAELGVPAACYPPDRDFLVRSRQRPDEITRTHEQFSELRSNKTRQPVSNRFGVTWAAPKVAKT